MPTVRFCLKVMLLLTTTASLAATTARAAEGEPLAVRRWLGGTVSVETHWGLHLVINPTEAHAGKLPFPRPADQEIRTRQILNNMILYRSPNTEGAMWSTAASLENGLRLPGVGPAKPGANAMRVRSGTPRKSEGCVRIEVDGVVIGFVPTDVMENSQSLPGGFLKDADVLIISVSDTQQLRRNELPGFVKSIGPKSVLLNPVKKDLLLDAKKFQEHIAADENVTVVDHNTLAISSSAAQAKKPKVVTLTTEPWRMDDDLKILFEAMEKSCSNSQTVFAELSVNQLNFEPPNGTHTPRWNCEHMMGRQLLFFSQIYHAIDPSIPVMNLNPKQMPPDYVFAHPDWDGKEEARQMQRVSDFTRRFAYLLEGMDVNRKAPGSSWPTLKALLRQMYRHYSEHTANTKKKFELPDWPKE